MSDNTPDNESNSIWGDPFQALIDHFEAHGIRYSSKREERRAWFTMNSGSALQKCSFRFDKTGDVLQIFIQYPVMVKERFRPAAMEFITLANYGLVIGNFEMDAKDGEIRYHVSHLMEENILTDETIRRLFATAMGTADRYFPALMRVLFAGETPEDAVDLAELDKFADESSTSKKPTSGQRSSTGKADKKTRSKRPRKPSSKTHRGGESKPQEDQPTSDSPAQSTPPPILPAPTSEAQGETQGGNEGEDRKAA
jgi:hypothetical protein